MYLSWLEYTDCYKEVLDNNSIIICYAFLSKPYLELVYKVRFLRCCSKIQILKYLNILRFEFITRPRNKSGQALNSNFIVQSLDFMDRPYLSFSATCCASILKIQVHTLPSLQSVQFSLSKTK